MLFNPENSNLHFCINFCHKLMFFLLQIDMAANKTCHSLCAAIKLTKEQSNLFAKFIKDDYIVHMYVETAFLTVDTYF